MDSQDKDTLGDAVDEHEKTVRRRSIAIVIISAIVIAAGFGVYALRDSSSDDGSESSASTNEQHTTVPGATTCELPERLPETNITLSSSLNVNYDKIAIPEDEILGGGPGKDGIPAITNPEFECTGNSDIADSVQVMYVEHGGVEKLYPYNVLVWHEIVNDTVGGKELAVTFCPLCGSAIVFERDVDGDILDFGVSGLLYQSNLLMYSREDDETLWSQSLGEAVVGERLGTTLTHYPTQVLTFGQAKELFPNAVIMTTDTGYARDYERNPYSGYDETEETIFPVSVDDNRFPAKEVFYIVPIEGNSIAVRQNKDDGTYEVPDSDITVTFDRGKITAMWGEAVLPGYFEMWFSWATHNQDNGIVLE